MADTTNYDGEIILSMLWDQNGFIECGNNDTIEFNEYAPLDPVNGKRSYTGCGNTSAGQIIYHFLENGWLDLDLTLTEQDTYASMLYGAQRVITIKAEGDQDKNLLSFAEVNRKLETFIGIPVDDKAADYTERSLAAAEYIAALNFACGVVNKAIYSNLSGTGSYPSATVFNRAGFKSCLALNELRNDERSRWFCTRLVNGKEKECLTEEAIEILIENLLDGRPVNVSISGHFIVLDGYDSQRDMFHFNYGWGTSGAGSDSEGSAAHTRWYHRAELVDIGIRTMELELRGSYIEEFTVTDSRFFGAGTFMHALEQANAMQGSNVISFSEGMDDRKIEIPHAYRIQDELTVKDFNLTLFGALFPPAEENRQEDDNKSLFTGDMRSSIRFENFKGNAVFQTSHQQDSIFEFESSIRTDLFFNGVKFYCGNFDESSENNTILDILKGKRIGKGEDADFLAGKTQKATVISASSGDDTIKFDNNSISIGSIDMDSGLNHLIIAGESQIFGDIAGSGSNYIFVDGTSNITGSLKDEAMLYFSLNEVNSKAFFTITGDAEETFNNIAGLTVDTTKAAAGEYLLFSWQTPAEIELETLKYEMTGNGQLSVNENSLVLTVTDPNAALQQPADWNASAAAEGNAVTLNWSEFANAAGYFFRYAKTAEALAGNGKQTGTNSADLTLNNGIWYFQVRAFDNDGNYSDWSSAEMFTVSNDTETITDAYLANGMLSDHTVDSGFSVLAGGILNNVSVSSSGTLTLEKDSITTGFLSVEENGSVEVLDGAGFVFDVGAMDSETSEPLISDFAAINGTFQFAVSVSGEQQTGTYILADNVEEWEYTQNIKVKAGDVLLGTFNEYNAEFVYENKAYSMEFSKENKQLLLSITDAIRTQTMENGSTMLRWHKPVGAEGYCVQISESENFDSRVQFFVDSENELQIIAPHSEICHWQTLTVGLENTFTYGGTIQAGESNDTPRVYESNGGTNAASVFFAQSSGVWGKGYAARHTGQAALNSKIDDVVLEGKARYQDIFLGNSADGANNMLFLSDGENGDAFFVDDIFSAFPDEQVRARFANLSDICGGAGDDIIDMTSTQFDVNDDIFLRGGAGDDVIWASSRSLISGDEGNDSIVGSSTMDYISGGAGDDILHGGGGNDFFLYGSPETWGHDTIYQTAGTVSLLFAGNGETILNDAGVQVDYDEENNVTTYTFDANNSITFVDLRPGQIEVFKQPVNAPYFDVAYSAGGFESYSSRRVFDTPATLA